MKTATEWPLASRRHTAGNRLVDIRIPGRFASRRCPDRALGGLGDRKSSVNSSRRRSMSFFLNPSKLDDSGMGITEYSPEFGLGSKSWKAVQLRECPFGFHVDPHCTTFPMPLAVSSHLAPDDYDSQPRKFTHRKTGRGEKIYYMRIRDFTEHAVKEVTEALNRFRRNSGRRLILDLRNNPGGLLDASIDIANLFVDSGIIAYTKGRLPHSNTTFFANPKTKKYLGFPVVVLIDRTTHGSAEIVAAAIRDAGRGILVGERTSGECLVASVYDHLEMDYAFVVSSGIYYSGKNSPIHHVGVSPDIAVRPYHKPEDIQNTWDRVRAEGILENYFKKRTKFTDGDIKVLMDTFNQKGIYLPESDLRYLIREQIYRNRGKNIIFDLGTDNQLHTAVEKIIQ